MEGKKIAFIAIGSLLAIGGIALLVYGNKNKKSAGGETASTKPSDQDADDIFIAYTNAKKRGSKMDILDGVSADTLRKLKDGVKSRLTKEEAHNLATFFNKYGTTSEKDIPKDELNKMTASLGKVYGKSIMS